MDAVSAVAAAVMAGDGLPVVASSTPPDPAQTPLFLALGILWSVLLGGATFVTGHVLWLARRVYFQSVALFFLVFQCALRGWDSFATAYDASESDLLSLIHGQCPALIFLSVYSFLLLEWARVYFGIRSAGETRYSLWLRATQAGLFTLNVLIYLAWIPLVPLVLVAKPIFPKWEGIFLYIYGVACLLLAILHLWFGMLMFRARRHIPATRSLKKANLQYLYLSLICCAAFVVKAISMFVVGMFQSPTEQFLQQFFSEWVPLLLILMVFRDPAEGLVKPLSGRRPGILYAGSSGSSSGSGGSGGGDSGGDGEADTDDAESGGKASGSVSSGGYPKSDGSAGYGSASGTGGSWAEGSGGDSVSAPTLYYGTGGASGLRSSGPSATNLGAFGLPASVGTGDLGVLRTDPVVSYGAIVSTDLPPSGTGGGGGPGSPAVAAPVAFAAAGAMLDPSAGATERSGTGGGEPPPSSAWASALGPRGGAGMPPVVVAAPPIASSGSTPTRVMASPYRPIRGAFPYPTAPASLLSTSGVVSSSPLAGGGVGRPGGVVAAAATTSMSGRRAGGIGSIQGGEAATPPTSLYAYPQPGAATGGQGEYEPE